MKRLINTFILGAIASILLIFTVIFGFDAVVYSATGWSISGNINAWLHADPLNVIIYIGALLIVITSLITASFHFYFEKYDKQ